ncbi:MAG: hypothetical protein ACM3US_09825 [Sphingomonadaceae bacterium]
MSVEMMMALAQFGFAAVAFYLVWLAYKDINPRLLEVIQQNSQALAEFAATMKEVVSSQKDLSVRMGKMDDRLLVLEQQHKHGRECPLTAMNVSMREGREGVPS